MGRVDEARRRAAEEGGAAPADTERHETALAIEAFPLEVPGRADAPAPEAPAGRIDMDLSVDRFLTEQAPVAPGTPSGLTSSSTFEHVDAGLAHKVVVDDKMNPASKEQYRRLAAALHHAQEASGVKVVLIASALAGEGKTLTASNLALTFSESYQRSVLLIDADFRRPSLHHVFKLDGENKGLGEGLTSIDPAPLPLYRISQRLTILPAGRPTSDPMAGLTSERMRRVIAEARTQFDWVIVDTPPVGLLTDANLLAAMVDCAVLVVKAESTPYFLVQRAIEALGQDRMIGVVLNRASTSAHPLGYKQYNYYDAYYGPSKKSGRSK